MPPVPVLDPTYDDPTPGGRMYRTDRDGVPAELERDMIRDRTRSGRLAGVDGGWTGVDAVLGFTADCFSGHPRLALHDGEAAMFRRVVSLLLDEGLTTGDAAKP